MITRAARPLKSALWVLGAAAVLLIGWAATACTIDSGLDQLPPEFSGICQEAYREACSKNVWAELEQLAIVRLRAMSVTGSPLTGSMKVRVYSFYRIPWADVEVTWSGGHLRGMTIDRTVAPPARDQAIDVSPDTLPDFTITSDGETTIPYENPLWCEIWNEDRGWLPVDAPTVFRELNAVLDRLPTVTLREDISLSHADNVSLGGLYVCSAEDLKMIHEGADRLYLTGLPEGTYYVGIQAEKIGDYIEAEKRHEMYGSEYVFRFVVDELSYDKMLRSRPAAEGISVMLRPTEYKGLSYFYGEAGYYVPADQEMWLDAFERAAASATEQSWRDGEGPLGVWIKHDDDYWCVMDSGSLVIPGSNSRRIEAEDSAELLALVRPAAKRYGVNVGAFQPDLIKGIVSATLTFAGEDHTATDPEVLAELEELLMSATMERVVSGCPFAALLTLQLEKGDPVKMVFAADSCRVYMVDGVCFTYGCRDHAEFFGLFGVALK
ncbi:MAG: hypothetical protein ACM3WU_06585 [Bacillota bacterium]